MASIGGGVLVIFLAVSLIVGMFTGTKPPDLLGNAFLIILGLLTLFQAALTAAVANFTLIANKTGPPGPSKLIHAPAKLAARILYGLWGRLSVPPRPFRSSAGAASSRRIVPELTS